ncbi:MAG: cadherin-like domain-containing protein [Chloroflexota bacterium]
MPTNAPPSFGSKTLPDATQGQAYNQTITVSDANENDKLSITSLVLPSWLAFSDNGDGTATLSGTPTNADVGDYTVTLQVADSAGSTATQEFSLTVINVNDAPVFTSLPLIAAREDTLYSYSIVVTDPDISGEARLANSAIAQNGDSTRLRKSLAKISAKLAQTAPGDTLKISAQKLPDWLTLTDNGNGTAVLTGTPANEDVGDHDVAIQVTDAGGATIAQSFTISVLNINDPPAFSSSPPTEADEDAVYNYSIITTVDPDKDDTLKITHSPLPIPSWLALTDNSDGTAVLSGTPTNAEIGDHLITLKVTDAAGSVGEQTFTITVLNVNDAPVITAGQSFTINENSANGSDVGTVLASDEDTEDTISFAITGGNLGNAFTINSINGKITVQDTDQLDYEQIQTFNLTIQVTDNSQDPAPLFSTGVVAVNLQNLNDERPVVTAGQTLNVSETAAAGAQIGSPLTATDADSGTTTFSNWTIQNVSNGGDEYFSLNSSSGQLTLTSFGASNLDYDDPTGREYILEVTVSDGVNTSASQAVTVNVTDVDDEAPTISVNNPLTLVEGESKLITTSILRADDVDTNNDNLIFIVTSGPNHGILEDVNSPGTEISSFTQAMLSNSRVLYIHDDTNTTSDTFAFNVTDNLNNGNTLTGQLFTITITPADDDDPQIVNNNTLTVAENGDALISNAFLSATDPDSNDEQLIYDITSGPQHGTVQRQGVNVTSFTQNDLTQSRIRYVHNGDEQNSDNFVFDLSDPAGNTVPDLVFNISVTPVNDSPAINNVNGGTVSFTEGDAPIRLATTGTITDAENVPFEDGDLTVVIATGAGDGDNLLISPGNGITLVGSTVLYNGTAFGTLTIAPDGHTLTVGSLLDTATLTALQNLLRRIAFQNTSNAPTPDDRGVTFRLREADGTISNIPVVTVEVTGLNDPPVISGVSGTVNFTENDLFELIANSGTVDDVDSADFDGGNLTATITVNCTADDLIGITPGRPISLVGTNIRYNGTVVGTYAGGDSCGAPLVVTFNTGASRARGSCITATGIQE